MKKKIELFREQIELITNEINDAIVSLMKKHNTENAYCVELDSTPIIIHDSYCDDNIHTLDEIILCDNGAIKFGCSSCFSNTYVYLIHMDIELLINVYEWIVENENEIFEENE